MPNEKRLLEVSGLKTYFDTDEGTVKAVDGVSFHIDRGETLAVVGESGSGKSVTSLSVMRLIATPPGRIAGGQIVFDGQDLVKKSEREMRNIRGNDISMIFQEPMTSLNPVYTVGDQIAEAIVLHQKETPRAALRKATEMLDLVGIPEPAKRVKNYPHQMSGGMRQRVMIAMALACDPRLIIADEPTTALDVTIQAQVFGLVREMRQASTAILLITHDMGVVWEMCDRVLVMYAARIVEAGSREEIFGKPAHPYTRGLLRSIPRLTDKPDRLAAIGGMVPSPLRYPPGCRFNDRCPHVFDRCRREAPGLLEVAGGHHAACFLARKLVRTPL
jgi:oligopeptide/dipeptide ABC transporter ATP-binding protein